MRKLFGVVMATVVVMLVGGSTVTFADRAYHSENLPLSDSGLEGHPDLQAGHVVNIHPNGPINFAHERYMVNGASPSTLYQVVIEVHESIDCDTEVPGLLPTAILATNDKGNGHAGVTLAPGLIDDLGLHGVTLTIRWSLRVGDENGPEAYGTECTEVLLD